MADLQPLSWATSASSCNPTTSDRLPEEVATCLQNARFLHLATCTQNQPHVSLMNYTYLPPNSRPTNTSSSRASQLPAGPTIIMTSNPRSKKTLNLVANPNVSLLVHDWVSARPPNVGSDAREGSPTRGGGGARSSSLATMLMQMNSTSLSSISATINGEARVLEPGTAEERWCKEQHLANNTFEGGGDGRAGAGAGELFGTSPADTRPGDGGRGSYIEDVDVRVVVVRIQDGRISDWKGGVKDWVIQDEGLDHQGHGDHEMVNGIMDPA